MEIKIFGTALTEMWPPKSLGVPLVSSINFVLALPKFEGENQVFIPHHSDLGM